MNSWVSATIISFISSSKNMSFRFARVWIRKSRENPDCCREAGDG